MKANLDPGERVSTFLPEWREGEKSKATLRNLMDHTSGLPAFSRYEQQTLDAGKALDLARREPLVRLVGEAPVYSDIGPILIGEILGLDTLIEAKTVGLRFLPDPALWPETAPTEPVEGWRREMWRLRGREPRPSLTLDEVEYLRGEVHDPRAALLGGVAGHAGLFGTIQGVADAGMELLQRSRAGDPVLAEWTSPSVPGGERGLLFDLDPGPAREAFRGKVFGHTGFTGTMLWVAPDEDRFAAMVSNRIHPKADSLAIRDVRASILRSLSH